MPDNRRLIFLSYARADAQSAERLHAFFQSERFASTNVRPWLDVYDLLPGERWDEAIRAALKAAEFVVIVVSQESVDKRGYFRKEVRAALARGEEFLDRDIFLIPVRIDDAPLPPELGDFQCVDLRRDDWQERIAAAVHAGLDRRNI